MNVKLSALDVASVLNPNDFIPIVQNGVTKKAAASLFFSPPEDSGLYVSLRGPWVTNTAYPKNSLVLQNGLVYLAIAAVPSRAIFTSSDWAVLGAQPDTTTVFVTTETGDVLVTESAVSFTT